MINLDSIDIVHLLEKKVAGSCLSDSRGRVIFMNETLRDQLGYLENELASLYIRNIIRKIDFVFNTYDDLIENNVPFITFNSRLISKSGEALFANVCAISLSINGELVVLTYFENITTDNKSNNNDSGSNVIYEFDSLTSREKDVFKLILKNTSQKHIAMELGISINTVKYHVSNIHRKLDIQSVSDIKESKNSILSLINSRNLESIFNAITDAITVHDKEYNIIYMNSAARKLLKEGGDHTKCFKAFHGKSRPPDSCISCACWESKKATNIEYYEPHLDKHLEISANPILDRQGHMTALIHQTRDISERKRLENEIVNAPRMRRKSDEWRGLNCGETFCRGEKTGKPR
jgi:PAS domain S-box-containing protein